MYRRFYSLSVAMNLQLMRLLSTTLFLFTLLALLLFGVFLLAPDLFPISGTTAMDLEDQKNTVFMLIGSFGGMSLLAKLLSK